MNNIKELNVITGLAGTGKTVKLLELIKKNKSKGLKILFLAFNKKIVQNVRYKLEREINSIDKSEIRTVHSHCYHVLKYFNKLPEAFIGIKFSDEDSIDNNDKPQNKHSEIDFDLLIENYLCLSENELIEYYNENKILVLFLDEYQDFISKFIKVTNRIIENSADQIKVYIAGDENQKIYEYINGKGGELFDNFNNIEADYNKTIDDTIILNVNQRTNPAIQLMLNYYLKNYLNLNEKQLYVISDPEIKNKYALPIFKWCFDKEEEIEFITSQIKKLDKSQRILITARYKNDLIIIQKYFKKHSEFKANDISISTIHKIKGDESDIVFYVGFNKNESPEEKRIIYTGLSRAIKKLFISSSYPRFSLEGILLVKEKGIQPTKFKTNNKLKKVQTNKNYSFRKYYRSSIDSIRLCVPYESASFYIYVESNKVSLNGKKIKRLTWENIRIEKCNNIDVTITYHKGHRCYYFDFYDLNLLKKNDYSDRDILDFCYNYVLKYFDNRISREKIIVDRIDLAMLNKYESEDQLKNKFKDYLSAFATTKSYSIYRVGNDIKDEISKYDIQFLDDNKILNSSFYFNFSKKQSLSFVIYRPYIKKNQNKIFDKSLLKTELRIKGKNVIKNKYLFGNNNLECIYLKLNENDKLTEVIKEVLRRNTEIDIKKLGVY